MTVAQFKERMDARFNAVDKRFNALGEKLDEILASLKLKYEHHDYVVDEHDQRIKDLETWRRAKQDTAR